MRILLVGFGSIGRRHLANLRTLLPAAQIAVWRHAPPVAGPEDIAGASCVLYDQRAALDFRADAAILANPAPFHLPVAAVLAAHGVHLFIEKPISHTAAGVAELLADCNRRHLVVMVGYNLRFDPSLAAARRVCEEGLIGKIVALRAEVGSYLPEWRPESDYRNAVSARPELGGGAVLELSHELDYMRWLGGEVTAVSARLGQLGALRIDVEDTAEITLQFRDGGIGQVHLDMIQRAATRTCRIIGTEGTVVWDGLTGAVQLFTSAANGWSTICAAGESDRNAMYLAELQHFLDCVRDRRPPRITGEDGWRALQIALAAKRSHVEQRVIPV